jgi:hypothetical protein
LLVLRLAFLASLLLLLALLLLLLLLLPFLAIAITIALDTSRWLVEANADRI